MRHVCKYVCENVKLSLMRNFTSDTNEHVRTGNKNRKTMCSLEGEELTLVSIWPARSGLTSLYISRWGYNSILVMLINAKVLETMFMAKERDYVMKVFVGRIFAEFVIVIFFLKLIPVPILDVSGSLWQRRVLFTSRRRQVVSQLPRTHTFSHLADF